MVDTALKKISRYTVKAKLKMGKTHETDEEPDIFSSKIFLKQTKKDLNEILKITKELYQSKLKEFEQLKLLSNSINILSYGDNDLNDDSHKKKRKKSDKNMNLNSMISPMSLRKSEHGFYNINYDDDCFSDIDIKNDGNNRRIKKMSMISPDNYFGKYLEMIGISFKQILQMYPNHIQIMENEIIKPFNNILNHDINECQKIKLQLKTKKGYIVYTIYSKYTVFVK